jgi:predicted transcriptional regulator
VSAGLPKEKQREPLEIMMEMNEFLFSFGPQKISKIERACNLRADLCKEYLNHLTDRQFIRRNGDGEYEMMEKGVEFLRATINLYSSYFPERRKEIEEGRFWRPHRRVTPITEKASQNGGAI